MDRKTCIVCLLEKELSSFPLVSKDKKYRRNKCYTCTSRSRKPNPLKRSIFNKKYYELNRKTLQEKAKVRMKLSRATKGEEFKLRMKEYRHNNIERIRTNKREWNIKNDVNRKDREKRYIIKNEVISHYSGGSNSCDKCGVNDLDMLCLDHVNNDGNVHRKKVGKSIYHWAKKHGYPQIFQVLCWNCNFLKSRKSTISKNQISDLKMKEVTFSHYSPSLMCEICKQNDIRLLSLDHIDGGGKLHRKSLNISGGSAGFYRWIRHNGYPAGFRVLCLNCNCKLGIMNHRRDI